MTSSRRGFLAGLAAVPLAFASARAAVVAAPSAPVSAPEVDLALLLAIDGSASITKGTLDFQLRGHAAAFRDPAVAQAIAGGSHRRIGIRLCQFAGPEEFVTLLPWRVLTGRDDCMMVAEEIDRLPGVAMGGSTALGAAVVAGVHALDDAPYRASRRAIDLVSNGFNNSGIDPISAGAYAAAAGVTVNALAILDEFDWLESYYAERVVAGEGAFVRTADTADSFTASFLAKLVAEIA